MKNLVLCLILFSFLILTGCTAGISFMSSEKRDPGDKKLKQSIFAIEVIDTSKAYFSGTGFVIQGTKDKYIVTNYHVVRHAMKGEGVVSCFIEDDREHFGHKLKIIGIDKVMDLALLKIDSTDTSFNHRLEPLPLGDSDKLIKEMKSGKRVFAKIAGYPDGTWLKHWGEVINPVFPGMIIGNVSQPTLILNTTKSYGGLSGCPLLNKKNEVIGINNGHYPKENPFGVSTPINDVKKILLLLENFKEVKYPFTGIGFFNSWEFQPKTYEIYHIPFPPQKPGVIIYKINADSPAGKADLRVGDIILEYDGKPIQDMMELVNYLRFETHVLLPFTITVLRNGEKMVKTLVTDDFIVPKE